MTQKEHDEQFYNEANEVMAEVVSMFALIAIVIGEGFMILSLITGHGLPA